MSDTDIAEILRLPIEERLRLVELIWESIAADPSAIPLGDAHRKSSNHASPSTTAIPMT